MTMVQLADIMQIDKVIGLVKEYFLLEDGVLIDHHEELLKLVEIDQLAGTHPHYGKRVYISRRALKHVVESRRKDLFRKHSADVSLKIILFAIESVFEVVVNFDNYELEPTNNHFYTKDFSVEGMPKVRILMELESDSLQVKSIHFMKRTKKHQI